MQHNRGGQRLERYGKYLDLNQIDKIKNYDGTEEYFKALEADLCALRYKIGSLEGAKLFLEIAQDEGNEKYMISCQQRDEKILAVLEKVCLENMDDLNGIRSYVRKHRDDYSVDLPYYMYLAAVNAGNKAYVKDYIKEQANRLSYHYGYEEIMEFLSEYQCNWEGDLEEYVWQLIQQGKEFFWGNIRDVLDTKLQNFNRGKEAFSKIQKFAAYNKEAYRTDKHNKDKSTMEEYVLTLARKHKKMTFIKFHNESKERFIKELEAMLADGSKEISDIRAYVTEENCRFSADLEDLAFRAAIRLGNRDYIKAAAPSLKLHLEQRYLRYLGETADSDINHLVREYGLWVKDHPDWCELVIRIDRTSKGGMHFFCDEVVHYEKNFLKEAYKECKDKGLDTDCFIELMNLERYANGRVKFAGWDPADVGEVIEALNYANQELYFEGHYTWGPFFEWQWEQDIHAEADQKIGWLYILKKPYRRGWNYR